MNLGWKTARRLVVGVVGGTVVLVGLALIVLPGPAFIVIPLGLAILASEFVWAKRLLNRVKDRVRGFPAMMQGQSSSGKASKTASESADHRHDIDPAGGCEASGTDLPLEDGLHQPPPIPPDKA